jgi:hypothetical protein
VPLRFEGPAYRLVPKCGDASYSLSLPASVPAPIRESQQMGSLRVTVGGKEIAKVPICAAENVERIGFGGLFARLALSLFGI